MTALASWSSLTSAIRNQLTAVLVCVRGENTGSLYPLQARESDGAIPIYGTVSTGSPTYTLVNSYAWNYDVAEDGNVDATTPAVIFAALDPATMMVVSDSGGQPMEILMDGTRIAIIPEGGLDFPLHIAVDGEISIRSLGATVTEGFMVLNFYAEA